MEVAALLGVREFLKLEDIKFSILFNESDDSDTIVLDWGTVHGGAEGGPLLHGYVLLNKTVYIRDEPGQPLSPVIQSLRGWCAKGGKIQPGSAKTIHQ